MLKEIAALRIEGARFENPTILRAFETNGNIPNGILLYGKNGTGKSTIAKAVRKAAGEDVQSIKLSEFLDKQNNSITLSDEEQKRIFVFDEDYIYKNVRIHTDSLDTIVMLGPAAELTDQIEKAKEEKNIIEIKYNEAEEDIKPYCNSKDRKSPNYYINKMKDALKGDHNWAGRDRVINGKRTNSPVSDTTFKTFVKIIPTKSRDELIEQYRIQMIDLKDAKTGTFVIYDKVPKLHDVLLMYNDSELNDLLFKRVERPILSDREKKLLELAQNGHINSVNERLEIFRDKQTIECPFCFQPVTSEYKESLVESIEIVLRQEVEEYRRTLEKFILETVDIDLSQFDKLKGFHKCLGLLEKLNKEIEENNNIIKERIINPYEYCGVRSFTIQKDASELKHELEELEKAREEYNNNARNTSSIVAKLNQINKEMAYYDICELVEEYEKQKSTYESLQKRRDELKRALDEKIKEIEDLESRRTNTKLAVDSINACLKYIFYDENILKIEYKDKVYKLQSNGKNVKPCDISVGERNIIGLSYFFTSIFAGQEEEMAYGKDYLIVIDDPVSSFDFENRVGILSFLRYKVSSFLYGNINTKVLIMTHDARTLLDIQKIYEDISEEYKSNTGKKLCFTYYEISKFSANALQALKLKGRQEYSTLIQMVYDFACGNETEYDIVIGNIIRQVLEAFSTFEYKKGISGISISDEILDKLQDEEYKVYFKNLMYRLVLNGGSHKEEQVSSMVDFDFFSLISTDEKQRTAKEILCFIHLLNPLHLKSHLTKGRENQTASIVANLETWCEQIKNRTPAT